MNAKLGRLVAAVMLALSVSACAPLVLGGAVGGAFMVTDRRTSGAFVEDQGIELKAERRIRDNMGERVHVNVSAYNRVALLTGEAASVLGPLVRDTDVWVPVPGRDAAELFSASWLALRGLMASVDASLLGEDLG